MTSPILSLDLIYLSLVSDEVDFRFAGLSWRWSRNVNFRRIFRFLDQNVDQGLLFILRLKRNNGSSWSWCTWCLDEDDLVVLLGLSYRDRSLWPELLGLWWRNVDVDVLLNGGTAAEAASETAAEAAAASYS